MIERDKTFELYRTSVRKIQWMSYGFIFMILLGSAALRRDSFLNMLVSPKTLSEVPAFICRIILFGCVLALILRWIAASAHELDILDEYVGYVFPRARTYMAMIAISITLGVMLVLIYDITIFSAYFSCYLLLNYWTQWVTNCHVKDSLKKTRRTKKNKEVREVLEHYWLCRPQLGRIVTMMFTSMVSLCFAIAGTVIDSLLTEKLHIIAYIILILNISIGEAIISLWRHRRDNDIVRIKESSSDK
ncbi:MAG: hypothetical protein ACFFCW_32645 [Candidatus Hodarchaeota archaeon]